MNSTLNRRFALIVTLFALVMLVASACAPSAPPANAADLPTGDAERGSTLYTQMINDAPACSTCHTLDGSTVVGPSLQGYGERAGSRVEGQSAEDYTLTSITRPAAYIVEGYANAMYAQYERALDDQQLADLIAFALSQ
jgi:mono/diheme cytochrome c family protein